MTVFQKVPGIDYKADECWINPSPAGLWARVAIVSMWTPLARTRKTWDDKPAVIGMLRTIPGIDLLVRGLLANPQIRVVVIDGTDASADKATSRALYAMWKGERADMFTDREVGFHAVELYSSIDLVVADRVPFVRQAVATLDPESVEVAEFLRIPNQDRGGIGRIVLPPPPPKANAPAPHGDPGERVAGDTLADVWPVVLQRIMAFGRPVPTQYGETRELLNLVSVIRDPAKSLVEIKNGTSSSDLREAWEVMGAFARGETAMGGIFGSISMTDAAAKEPLPEIPHRILGLTYAQVADYARQFIDPVPPGGDGTAYAYGARLRSSQVFGSTDLWHRDQITAIHSLLTVQPNTRAAFLTTWRPESDSGVESGRPCLVGVTFRATPGPEVREVTNLPISPGGGPTLQAIGPIALPSYALHMTVTFRSHDMHGAYPLNVAALCLWLCEEAKSLGMAVGTFTCVSQSAHVYERDYNAANAKVDAHKWPAINWDTRSTWRVEVYETEEIVQGVCVSCVVAATRLYRLEGVPGNGGYAELVCEAHRTHDDRDRPLPKVTAIRAVCLTPDGNKVTRIFEGKTASGLLQEIERSGLCSNVGNALWLGGELVKAEGKL
jgi:thymidylate synthase